MIQLQKRNAIGALQRLGIPWRPHGRIGLAGFQVQGPLLVRQLQGLLEKPEPLPSYVSVPLSPRPLPLPLPGSCLIARLTNQTPQLAAVSSLTLALYHPCGYQDPVGVAGSLVDHGKPPPLWGSRHKDGGPSDGRHGGVDIPPLWCTPASLLREAALVSARATVAEAMPNSSAGSLATKLSWSAPLSPRASPSPQRVSACPLPLPPQSACHLHPLLLLSLVPFYTGAVLHQPFALPATRSLPSSASPVLFILSTRLL